MTYIATLAAFVMGWLPGAVRVRTLRRELQMERERRALANELHGGKRSAPVPDHAHSGSRRAALGGSSAAAPELEAGHGHVRQFVAGALPLLLASLRRIGDCVAEVGPSRAARADHDVGRTSPTAASPESVVAELGHVDLLAVEIELRSGHDEALLE
jgi:hypothetical protein